MFGVIHSTETESGYGSYINLNPHPESSANREGHNGFEGVSSTYSETHGGRKVWGHK